MSYELLVLAFGILFAVVRFIYRGIKWLSQQQRGVASGPNPVQQAVADVRRQFQPAPAQLPPPPAFQLPPAGGPAVVRETTEADFARQEQELLTEEPPALNVSLQSPASPARLAPDGLFRGADDLVRAFILREALGPPLSRRRPLQ